MSTYEPGTVALATVRGVPNVRVFRWTNVFGCDEWQPVQPIKGVAAASNDQVTDVHPLITIDMEDLPPNALVHALRGKANGPTSLFSLVANQIEAQTKPPTPAEPTDPAARVIDRCGDAWASFDGQWWALAAERLSFTWDELVQYRGPLEVRP